MENPMLDFEMEQSEKLKKAFYEGYEAGKKDAEYYALHCGDTDEPETKADSVRSMSDEEMAKIFANYISCHNCPIPYCKVRFTMERLGCQANWLDWLKQEVTEQ